MSKKLNIQAVNAAADAAADANTRANEVREALRARLSSDLELSLDLARVVAAVYQCAIEGGQTLEVKSRNRDQLEPTANSYGYTLADHPTRRDLVVVQPLES